MAKKAKAETEENTAPKPAIRCSHSALVDPKTLKQHPENPNFHPKKQLLQYVKIINFNGWRRPITVSKRSGFIVKGHGACQASLLAGYEEVPVDYQDYDNAEAEIADLLADNQLGNESEQNKEKISELMTDLLDNNFDIDMTGFTRDSLAEFLEEEAPKKKKREKKDTALDHLPDFIISITLKDEQEQRMLYEELLERGYECKLI